MEEASSRLYFTVSGEHPTLPKAELIAILETLGVSFKVLGFSYKHVDIDADPTCLVRAGRRGGFIEESGVEIFRSPATYNEIAEAAESAPLEDFLAPADTFSVRISRFGEESDSVSTVKLESAVGDLIVRRSAARVNLRAPGKQFRGILTGGDFHFGLSAYSRPRGSVASRRPRKRPVFHPSTMVPKLARCMVNLSRPSPNGIFLDPFCGVGGILIEAGFLGCQVVGVDALSRMLRGTRRNLKHFGFAPLGLVKGDARHLPVARTDSIATDPPYGTGASTLKSTTARIMGDFLPEARNVLSKGRRVVIASPTGTRSPMIAENAGFRVEDRHLVYVHRSLTREILVLVAA